jgi:hypothetical protein
MHPSIHGPNRPAAYSRTGGASGREIGMGNCAGDGSEERRYEICVEGHLDPQWSEWLGGMRISHHSDGSSRLEGSVPDQAGLHGLLGKLHNLRLHLRWVRRLDRRGSPRR